MDKFIVLEFRSLVSVHNNNLCIYVWFYVLKCIYKKYLKPSKLLTEKFNNLYHKLN